jgi:hypothetical protein
MVVRSLVALAIAAIVVALAPSAADAKRGPLHAKVKLDRARATSAQITVAAGGTISVRTRNGTRVRVTFPAGAVAKNTRVTATPVRRLASRKTRRGLLAGVQLQPEGLQLRKPALVRFSRRGNAKKGTQMVFVGSEGRGRDIHRLPPPVKVRGRGKQRVFSPTGKPAVAITHFSTVDAFDWSNATLQDIDAVLYPELGIHRMSQELSKLFKDKNTTWEEIAAAYERERKRFIDPLVSVALQRLKSSCSVEAIKRAQNAASIATSFSRQMAVLGLEGESAVPLLSELLTETAVCMGKLCPVAGDPRAAVYFTSLARQLQLLGVGDGPFMDALLENMERCGAYEVRLDSRIDTEGDGASFSMRVAGKVKVTPSLSDFAGQTPPERGALDYQAYSGSSPSECVVVAISGVKSGEFELSDLQFTDFDPAKPFNDPVRSMRITITAQPSETYHSTLTGGQSCGTTQPPDYDIPQWFFGFQAEHPGFTFPGADFFRDAPPVFALAVYSPRTIDLGNGSISENTKVEIVHTPLPPVPLPQP